MWKIFFYKYFTSKQIELKSQILSEISLHFKIVILMLLKSVCKNM